MLHLLFVSFGIHGTDGNDNREEPLLESLRKMGFEWITDAPLITEADLRAAGLPRITCRKILPTLQKIGEESEIQTDEIEKQLGNS